MEVIICKDTTEMGEIAARHIIAVLARSTHPVLGVATGSSPLSTYQAMARLAKAGMADFSNLSAFALDEYIGLSPDDERSYTATIKHTVTEQLGLDPANVHVPEGSARDLVAACQNYEKAIKAAGGVDIQILGIGGNGHIGFNEPSSPFSSRTRVMTLAPRTRDDNQRFFRADEAVPTHCLTQGLGTIMEARHLVLLANGEAKAGAIAAAVEGPVSAMCPASVLQFHQQAVVIVDEAAASKLGNADYYRHVQKNQLDGWGVADQRG